MTSPPCEEYVTWFVVAKPNLIGSTTLQMIREALFIPGHNAFDQDANYDGSNRSVMPETDRIVFYYDRLKDCENPYEEPAEGVGHWEKVEKKVQRYFYVSGDEPSGMT